MAELSLQKIEAIAPDQASLQAARKLINPGIWSGLSTAGAGLVWGECQGSGATPYRVVISESDAGYKCSCPSRKFPCKHSLALMWMRVEGKAAFAEASPPQWVQDWQRRRRPAAKVDARDEALDESSPRPAKNIALTASQELPTADPVTEARAAAARERGRLERESSVTAGVDDLDQWLADQIDVGIAAFAANPGKACRLIAQRLVDAKAGGLANRLDELPGYLYTLPDGMRPLAAIRELGQLHLLAQAWRRQDSLDLELRADLRREIGWTSSRETLLDDRSALRTTGTWRIFATVEEAQQDRLRRFETWMWHESPGDGPRFAVLIDFVPLAAGGARNPWMKGEHLEATLVFYPSALPLRAIIGNMEGSAQACYQEMQLPDSGLEAAWESWESSLAIKPWLRVWPLQFRGAQVRRSGQQYYLCSTCTELALPILRPQAEMVAPLLCVERVDGFALWDGSWIRMCLGQTELGFWGIP